MRSDFKIFDSEFPYFITSTIVDWIPVFKSESYCRILVDNFKFYQKKNLKIFAFVIMPNHFHMICHHENLSRIISDFKKFTAKQILDLLKKENDNTVLSQFSILKKKHKTQSNYQVWQEGFHPQQILTQKVFNQKAEYIHYNPVRKNLVTSQEDWKYSSAKYYLKGERTEIEIDSF